MVNMYSMPSEKAPFSKILKENQKILKQNLPSYLKQSAYDKVRVQSFLIDLIHEEYSLFGLNFRLKSQE